MADDPPLSTTVPETTTVDLGVDKEQLGNLTEAFDDFWKSEDQKIDAPEAPAAPTEGPGQETREARALAGEPKTETKPPQVERKPPPTERPAATKEFSDEEIDKLELAANARPELVEQFRVVKDSLKAERVKARELAREREALSVQLAEARQNAWTPELKADYEQLVGLRRRVDFTSDPYFVQNFYLPVMAQYEAILDETVGMLPDRNAAIEWANLMKQNYKPDQLNRDWWLQSVVNKVPNELDRSTLLNSISQLEKLRKERDSELTRRTGDRSAYDNYVQEKNQSTQAWVQQEIRAEIAEQEKDPAIRAILPRDPAQAKTADERRAIEEHNEWFKQLNNSFQNHVIKLGGGQPRDWVKIAVLATKAHMMEQQLGSTRKELEGLKAERDQYKSELDKITGARRKIAHTTGTPPSSPEKKNNNQGLSIKDLDIRKAFDSFDWGDRT